MTKESPWAGGFTPRKPTEEQYDHVDKIAAELWRTTIEQYLQRVKGMPIEEQGGIAMLLVDRLTSTFIAGLTRGDNEEAASFVALHTVNVMRSIKEEFRDE